MTKVFSRKTLMAVAATAAVALPGTAHAGGHHRDCLDKMFRDLDRGMTRVVHHTDRTLTRMFRWCDRHRK